MAKTKKTKAKLKQAGQKKGAVKKTFYPSVKVNKSIETLMKKEHLNFSDAVNKLVEQSLK